MKVTLILLFIFVTPHLWNYGATPPAIAGPANPIQVSGDGGRGLIVTVNAADVKAPAGAPDAVVKKALREAIEPVTGDAVFVQRWESVTDAQGNPINGSMFLGVSGRPETARSVTILGATGRVRSYRWTGNSWIQ